MGQNILDEINVCDPQNMGRQLEGVPLEFCVLNSVGCKTCQLISISYIAINNWYVLKLSTNSLGCHPILDDVDPAACHG